MARQHIYTVYRDTPTEFRCVKMERDFEAVETYQITLSGGHLHCTCFASNKATCRHRQLVEIFDNAGAFGSRKAYDFDKGKWVEQPEF